MFVVTEDDVGLFDATFALDVDLVGPIHEDVGDRRILEQQLQRTQSEELVEHIRRDRLPLEQTERHRRALAIENHPDHAADFGLGVGARDLRQPVEVEPIQQFLVDAALEFQVPGRSVVNSGPDSPDLRYWDNSAAHGSLLCPPECEPTEDARRRRTLLFHDAAEVTGKASQRVGQRACLERHGPTDVQRLKGHSVIARDYVLHRIADDPLDVGVRDLGAPIEAIHHRHHARRAVPRAEHVREPPRTAQ